MSNDKVAATGLVLHWAVGTSRTACGAELGILTPTVPLRDQLTCGNCILALSARDMHIANAQPTGPQMWQKIVGDDLYRDASFRAEYRGQVAPTPARGKMLTKSEIGLALGIITFIIVLFAFGATAYRM